MVIKVEPVDLDDDEPLMTRRSRHAASRNRSHLSRSSKANIDQRADNLQCQIPFYHPNLRGPSREWSSNAESSRNSKCLRPHIWVGLSRKE